MNSFQTITQYINSDINNPLYNKNACHFFALKTAYEYMKKKEASKTTHEANIYFAVNLNKLYQNQDMYFDEIIKFTNLKSNQICATTSELIKSGDYPIELLFQNDKSYCTIVLKNAKFFCVMHLDGKYYVRDCHEPFQYDFSNKNDFLKHLNTVYQFTESIIVDGFPIPEFSSIEYIIIDKQFYFELTNEKVEEPVKMKDTDFGLKIEHIEYEESEKDKINLKCDHNNYDKNINNIDDNNDDNNDNNNNDDNNDNNNDDEDYEDMPELEPPM